jgi:hypothetical protein
MTNTDAAILQDIRKRLDNPAAIQFLSASEQHVVHKYNANEPSIRAVLDRLKPQPQVNCMGHKAVVIVNFDVLDNMEKDPAEFVSRLKHALLTYRRLGGSVSMGGATVANVVWSGHADLTPFLKIQDFQAINVTEDARELEALGFRLQAAK